MLDKPGTYPMACSMTPSQAAGVGEMIKSKFSAIGIIVNPDRRTYGPLQAEKVPVGQVLVTFCMPREGVNMVDFFREFNNTLNQESTAMAQKERAT